MFAPRYFPKVHYAGRYFAPPSGTTPPPADESLVTYVQTEYFSKRPAPAKARG